MYYGGSPPVHPHLAGNREWSGFGSYDQPIPGTTPYGGVGFGLNGNREVAGAGYPAQTQSAVGPTPGQYPMYGAMGRTEPGGILGGDNQAAGMFSKSGPFGMGMKGTGMGVGGFVVIFVFPCYAFLQLSCDEEWLFPFFLPLGSYEPDGVTQRIAVFSL